ncbi:MAG TPA: YebC/PmpR family DNA-binding transcriptional regulator [Thermoanaerobaculia bacterium]|jgi:YebC/PmpR family DNA-binding regulatory protein|nr:YebC/PmpR family DNA-binding transcriptional regulator [Thermoanaerobaculia bacterium]
MSGHSKWSTIKHKKAATDARRGKLFSKLLKEITVAARVGGGDPKGNPRLRAAILEARSNSVPNDNIDRAVKKGTGELEAEVYEEVIYEGYGPGGVAILVEAATDNRNRTTGEIRHTFARNGGSLGEAGCVAWMFHRRGYFAIPRDGKDAMDEEKFMELALELGADDVSIEEEAYEIYTPMEDFLATQEELERRGVPTAAQELAMIPQTTVDVPPDKINQVLRLMEALEDHDDAQKVWANLNIDEKVLEAQSR